MKHKESTENGGGASLVKPLKKEGGLVSQIASKFQNNDTSVSNSVRVKKTSDSILYSKVEPPAPAIKKNSVASVASVSRTESHQARFNSARAMFEKMGSADDLDSISSNEKNRGSRASSVQRSRSTSPFNSKVTSATVVANPQPPRSPEVPELVSYKYFFVKFFLSVELLFVLSSVNTIFTLKICLYFEHIL